jgi:hypothetical protein
MSGCFVFFVFRFSLRHVYLMAFRNNSLLLSRRKQILLDHSSVGLIRSRCVMRIPPPVPRSMPSRGAWQ